jgi:hypothetical protein
MTVAEFALDEDTVTNIVERVTYLTNRGMTRDEAVARVVAEYQSFGDVVSTAHFAHSELILRYRLKTGDWDEPITKDELLSKYLPG